MSRRIDEPTYRLVLFWLANVRHAHRSFSFSFLFSFFFFFLFSSYTRTCAADTFIFREFLLPIGADIARAYDLFRYSSLLCKLCQKIPEDEMAITPRARRNFAWHDVFCRHLCSLTRRLYTHTKNYCLETDIVKNIFNKVSIVGARDFSFFFFIISCAQVWKGENATVKYEA